MNGDGAARMVCLILGASCVTGAAAAELGRLFYTPAQRAEMDRKRLLDPRAGGETPSQRVVNGRITRSDGKSITWVNGAPDENPHSQRAKVGQSLNAAGEVQDNSQGGRLVIGPAR